MRRLTAAALLATGCATATPPPGGPPDEDPPKLLATSPDTSAVRARVGRAVFQFDEVISQRPAGASSLEALFLISPSDGQTSLSWKRSRLEVSPKGGFRENTTYVVRLLAGLSDLDGNVDSAGTTLVFSTGPSIATGVVRGASFDWLADRAAPLAYIEAIHLPDSTKYLAYADSTGRYQIDHLPTGRFLLRASVDQNRNRRLDPRELFDTVTVQLSDSLKRDLYAALRDTIGPRIERVDVVDSLTLRIRFDRPLDTAFVAAPRFFTIKTSDSAVVAIADAIGGRAWQKIRDDSLARKAAADSVKAAAAADSAARAPGAQRPAATRRPANRARADSAPPPLKPTLRIPDVEVLLTLLQPLAPGTALRVRADSVRSLAGVSRPSERQFSTQRARPKADSTARRDSTPARRPPT